MFRIKKMILSVLCLCVLSVVISGTTVGAVPATTRNLPAGILIGDQDGIYVDANGYYYIEACDLNPGDVNYKKITVQNLSQNDRTPEGKVPYVLSMTAEPLFFSGPVNLFDETNLIITLDGKLVYDGSCRGDGNPNMIDNALPLGTYDVGDRHTLEFTITVSPDMPRYWEKSQADFRWQFYAYKTIEDNPPKTGILVFLETYGYLLPVCLLFLFMFVLIPLKKKRDENMRQAS